MSLDTHLGDITTSESSADKCSYIKKLELLGCSVDEALVGMGNFLTDLPLHAVCDIPLNDVVMQLRE